MMKSFKFIQVAVASLLAISSTASQKGVRGVNDRSKSNFQASSCSKFADENTCNASADDDNIQCVWCVSAAVPPGCMNTEESKHVPPSVFTCDSSADIAIEGIEAMNSDGRGYDGSLLTYNLRGGVVDENLCDPSSKSLSGYVDISGSQYDNGGDKHLFYWFFEKRASENATDIPIILWLTGGPGCSSTLALLFENGPCKVNEDGMSTTINPYSWTEAAHVLWLDQPAGVGYSFGDENDYNEEMISEDAYYFLQKFYEENPQYSENPLTIVGESYGGHYAPAVAHKVWTKNKDAENTMMKINLAGLATGNGLTNPYEQYKYYPEMAVNNSHAIKVLPDEIYNEMTAAVPKCQALIQKCNEGDSVINKFACQAAFIVCNTAETTPYQLTGLNPYDIRKQCDIKPLCYDFSNIEKFLNSPTTREALHVTDESGEWTSCNMGINMKFHSDWMHDFSPFVADLLNDGIHTLVYAGDVDYICNYLGNRAWTLALDWKFQNEFNLAPDHEWGSGQNSVGTGAAGLVKTSNGFTFMQVYDAGHMVPTDQPQVALEMIRNFVSGGEF